MTLAYKTDYVAEGLSYLRQASAGRPNLQALLTAFLQHSQKIEDAAQGLLGVYDIDNATGAALDGIGAIVGAQRNGLDDASYKLFLRAEIAANKGDASLNAVVSLAKKLFQANACFAQTPLNVPLSGIQGAFVMLALDAPQLPQALWPLATRLLKQNLPAGVQLAEFSQSGSKAPFAFDGERPSMGGFGSINDPTSGGPLGSLIPTV